jgi:lysophospholipase L1-like esterase
MARMWKNLLLLAGALVLVALLLEGGSRILRLYQPPESAAPIAIVPAQEDATPPPAPVYGPNEGNLDSIHAPDQWVWWRVKPNLENYHVHIAWNAAHDFTLSTDANGFRATGEVQAAPVRRVLVVGDSTAFGVGVDDADTWPAQLEAILNAQHGVGVEVVNAGVPGFSTFQALRMAEKWAANPRPDVVVVCAGFNDSANIPKGELPDLQRAARNERDYAQGQQSAFLSLLSQAVAAAQQSGEGAERPRLLAEELQETLSTAEQHYREQGIPLIWIHWPTQAEAVHGAPLGGAGYPAVLLAHCEGEGLRCVDLMPRFKAMGAEAFYDFVHATAAGNRAAAEEIAAALADVIPREPPDVH